MTSVCGYGTSLLRKWIADVLTGKVTYSTTAKNYLRFKHVASAIYLGRLWIFFVTHWNRNAVEVTAELLYIESCHIDCYRHIYLIWVNVASLSIILKSKQGVSAANAILG